MANYQDAYNHLISNVYAPVFFNKLAADFGLRPSDENEQRELLSLAGRLESIEKEHQVKQAQERTGFVNQASGYLDHLLGHGPTPSKPSPSSYSDQEVKQAAAELTSDQSMRDAALLYSDYIRQVTA